MFSHGATPKYIKKSATVFYRITPFCKVLSNRAPRRIYRFINPRWFW